MIRFLVDECIGPSVASWLAKEFHDVLSIYQESPGLGDIEVLRLAFDTGRVLITADKDFGEMIFREGRPHKGIILLRLGDERPSNKIDVLQRLIQQYSGQLPGNFVVATDSTVRIIEIKS